MKKANLVAFGLPLLVACNSQSSPTTTTADPRADTRASSLTRVANPSEVCMVNDQFMGREQIPVAVDGKTYYGCCAMCKARLERDASIRAATDPVTGRTVDKARAVIGKTESGSVLYFETAETFARYASR
jgi:YHS domain-containing protein